MRDGVVDDQVAGLFFVAGLMEGCEVAECLLNMSTWIWLDLVLALEAYPIVVHQRS